MFELIACALLGAGGVTLFTHLQNKKRLLALPATKAESLDESLSGIRGGVYIREPNGSAHSIQNLVEQKLAIHGMALHNLRRGPAENLLKDGEWDMTLAQSTIDVAVVGRIITEPLQVESFEYPTVRHIHTPTGKRFNDLPIHNDFRGWSSGDPGPSGFHYNEPWHEFSHRRELEKQSVTKQVYRLTLDVRFYGPDGAIRGGYTHTSDHPTDTVEAWGSFVSELTEALAAVLRKSIAAHDRSIARQELGI